jgi:hypothetical protein
MLRREDRQAPSTASSFYIVVSEEMKRPWLNDVLHLLLFRYLREGGVEVAGSTLLLHEIVDLDEDLLPLLLRPMRRRCISAQTVDAIVLHVVNKEAADRAVLRPSLQSQTSVV